MESVLPKILEPVRRQIRVLHGMRDEFVPEVMLDRSGILPVIRELIARCVPEHVRVDWKAQFGCFTRPCHDLARRRVG